LISSRNFVKNVKEMIRAEQILAVGDIGNENLDNGLKPCLGLPETPSVGEM